MWYKHIEKDYLVNLDNIIRFDTEFLVNIRFVSEELTFNFSYSCEEIRDHEFTYLCRMLQTRHDSPTTERYERDPKFAAYVDSFPYIKAKLDLYCMERDYDAKQTEGKKS